MLFLAGMDLTNENAAVPFVAAAVMKGRHVLLVVMIITVPFRSAIKMGPIRLRP